MLKAGLIGFGRMGITHMSILNAHPAVKICAVCDQSSTMLNILNKYVDFSVYQDYRKMIADNGLDFVVISTPSDSHSEIINYCIDKNLHIFTEKPFGMTTEEGKKSLELLKGKNLVNQVGYVNRFNEVFMEVKDLLGKGVIGDIKNYKSEMYGATVLKDSKASWRAKKNTGGGCMYEFASHCIDLALYLFDQPDYVRGSVLQSVYSSDVEDMVSSTFYHDKGFTGNILVNWSDEAFRKPTNIITVFGTKGKIIADKHAYKIYLREENPQYGFHKMWNTRYITDFVQSVRFYVRGNEFTRQLDYFVEGIETGRQENISGFEEGLKTDTWMEKIVEDAARGANEEVCESVLFGNKPEKRRPWWKRVFWKS